MIRKTSAKWKFEYELKLIDTNVSLVPQEGVALEDDWNYLVVMGNALSVSKDSSLVFDAPYAWIGTGYSQQRIGTILKFDGNTGNIKVPKPVDLNKHGAHWGYKSSRRIASGQDLHRLDMTGVSFVKGN